MRQWRTAEMEGAGRTPWRVLASRPLFLGAAALLGALIPLVLLAGLWVRSEFAQGRRDLGDYLEARAAGLAQRLDSEIGREITVLQAMAALPSLDGPDLARFHEDATRMVAAMPPWRMVGLIDAASGRLVADTRIPPGTDPPRPALAERQVRAVLDVQRPVVQTREGASGARMVRLLVPVLREGGARHVLVADKDAAQVQDILAEQSDDLRLLGLVVDERGRVLARSRNPDAYLGQEAHPQLLERVKDGPGGVFAAKSAGGEEVLTAFQRLPRTGWTAVVATDRGHFDQLAARSSWATAATGALSLALALALAVFVFHSVMERRVAAERLAASRAIGDLDARLLATSERSLAEQQKAASEREVLLREIYHRVKNNLQIVQSLLRLGARKLQPEQREPFEGAIRRIGAMSRVHTLLYNSPDLASIELKDYLDGLVGEIAEGFAAAERGITTEVAADPMRVPLDTATPLAFIAVEMLTNAYRHAFPPGRPGTVRVSATRRLGQGVLTVSDDGIGMPAERGGERSLGLTIIGKLVQQIGGTLEQPGPGQSSFTVRFPLDAEPPERPAEHP